MVNEYDTDVSQRTSFRARSPGQESVSSIVNYQSDSFEEKKQDVVDDTQTTAKVSGYFNIPQPLTTLKHGDIVRISDFEDGVFYLKTKECVEKGQEINAYIRDLDKSSK